MEPLLSHKRPSQCDTSRIPCTSKFMLSFLHNLRPPLLPERLTTNFYRNKTYFWSFPPVHFLFESRICIAHRGEIATLGRISQELSQHRSHHSSFSISDSLITLSSLFGSHLIWGDLHIQNATRTYVGANFGPLWTLSRRRTRQYCTHNTRERLEWRDGRR